MNKQFTLEFKVGLFVVSGLVLMMLAILLLGGGTGIFSRPLVYHTQFKQADGLFQGGKVVIGGLSVGNVGSIDLDPKTQEIAVELKVEHKYGSFIRQGAETEILTQGMLGDKYISITQTALDQPLLEPGSELPARPAQDIRQVLSRSDELLQNLSSLSASLDRMVRTFETENSKGKLFVNLNETVKNLSLLSKKLDSGLGDDQIKRATRSLNQVLDKLNNGNGTLGALINDPSLYDDIKALTGGANRNRVVRNLVRQTIRSSREAEQKESSSKDDASSKED